MQSTSGFLTNTPIHSSWQSFFELPFVMEELQKIERAISGKTYTPKTEQVLRFATVDMSTIKVIILGMDPYPTRNANGELVATGRAFEVQGATSWFDSEISPSLRNMVKLIHKAYLKKDKDIGAGIDEVRKDIENGKFLIPTPDKAFDYWEEQGALWLNTAFTCEVGGREQSGSHLLLWKPFFKLLLQYIAEQKPTIKYFLWGNDAIKFGKLLQKQEISEDFLYESKHPCTNGDKGGYRTKSAFLENPCFHKTKNIIDWVLPSS